MKPHPISLRVSQKHPRACFSPVSLFPLAMQPFLRPFREPHAIVRDTAPSKQCIETKTPVKMGTPKIWVLALLKKNPFKPANREPPPPRLSRAPGVGPFYASCPCGGGRRVGKDTSGLGHRSRRVALGLPCSQAFPGSPSG